MIFREIEIDLRFFETRAPPSRALVRQALKTSRVIPPLHGRVQVRRTGAHTQVHTGSAARAENAAAASTLAYG